MEKNMSTKTVYYFDTNIVSNIFSPDQVNGEQLKLQTIIASILCYTIMVKDEICFPFGVGHFRDIYYGSPEYENQKLETLKNFTNEWTIYSSPEEEFVSIKKIHDIEKEYGNFKESMVHGLKFQEVMYKTMNPVFNIAAEKFEKQLVKTNTILKKELRDRYVNAVKNYGPKTHLEFLKITKQLKSSKVYFNGKRYILPNKKFSVVDLNKRQLLGTIDSVLKESNVGFSSLEEYLNKIENSSKEIIYDSFLHKIGSLSTLLDILGITSEKLKKNCSSESIITDTIHLSHGLRSHFFITEDENLFQKALFVKKILELPVYVMKTQNFITHVITSYLLNKENLQEKIVVTFPSKSKNPIATIEIIGNIINGDIRINLTTSSSL